MRVLALDFDGVISDSAPEAFWVALRTYVALRPTSRLARELEQIESAGAGRRAAAIVALRLYEDFVELMPLGNRAEDFGVELSVLEAEISVPDQAAYHEQRDAHSKGFLDAFHARFYREREALAAGDPAAWFEGLAPYPEFARILERRAGDATLAIATAKDRSSVTRLLDRYGLSHLFAPELVCDKETGVSKRAHVEELARRTGTPFAEITFVDDKLNHLGDVAGLGVRCALAAWGYNGPREREAASRRGFVVCELSDFEALLFEPQGG